MGQSTEELSTEIAGTRENLASDLDALQDRVSPSAIVERRKVAARNRLLGVKDKVMGSSQTASDSAKSGVSGAADSVKGAAGSAKEGAQSAVSSAGDTIEGSPLAAGLVAFGAGLVIAGLIPATRAETRASQKVVEAAKEHGQPLVDEAKSMGQDVGDQLKESATDAAQQVKQTAQESAGRVQEEGQSSAENVKSSAPGQS